MIGRIAALARHPVKGFTPEPLSFARLEAGAPFPHDRLYALEAGPCGFDARAPRHISKMKLATLAPIPALARVVTAYDDSDETLQASAEGLAPYGGMLAREEDRDRFAAWLETFLAAAAPGVARGPVRMLASPGHRFFDDTVGAVSLINLATVRALSASMGVALEPGRFRANILVEGWPAWIEHTLAIGARLRLGGAGLVMVKPIPRCLAVHVDPVRGVCDLDVSAALFALRGDVDCGLYLRVEATGRLEVGDTAEIGA